jgi:hypothetical protein
MADAPEASSQRSALVPGDTPTVFDPARPWESVSLAISGFRDGAELRPVLRDWIEFIGGRPGEVVYVDGGSPAATVRRLTGMVADGLIDRLELLTPGHYENHRDRCYVQEYRTGRLATLPYVMFIKMDTLAYRRGFDTWLAEDLAALNRPGVFSVTHTHQDNPPVGREGPYLVHDFTSLNFGIMKRSVFDCAVEDQIGDLVRSNFRGEYPVKIRTEERFKRMLVEWLWHHQVVEHGLRTLARAESIDYTINHVNKRGWELLRIRRGFRARKGLDRYYDAPLYYRAPPGPLKRFGQGVEGVVRRVRHSVLGPKGATRA